MSDIPVGSPPAPPGRHAAPTGWYPDPVNSAQERYWDGWQWSRNTRPRADLPGGGYGQAPYASYPAPNVTRPPGYAAPRMGSVQATMTADGVPLASWWWRVLAVLIDSLITTAIVTVITFPVWRSLYASDGQLLQRRHGCPTVRDHPTNVEHDRSDLWFLAS